MSYTKISLPKELADEIDSEIKNSSYRNRSEFCVEKIRQGLAEFKKNKQVWFSLKSLGLTVKK